MAKSITDKLKHLLLDVKPMPTMGGYGFYEVAEIFFNEEPLKRYCVVGLEG